MKDDIIEIDANATMTPMIIPALGTPSSNSLAKTMLKRKRLCGDEDTLKQQASRIRKGHGQGNVKTGLSRPILKPSSGAGK